MGVPSRTAWLIAAGDTCRGRAAAVFSTVSVDKIGVMISTK